MRLSTRLISSNSELVEVGYDRYGANIGLVVNGKNDEAEGGGTRREEVEKDL